MKEYPLRPKLVLDGEHLFSFDPENRGVRDEWFMRKDLPAVRIPVPGTWQAHLRMSANVGWYWIPFQLDESFRDRWPYLRFEAADYRSDAWLNGSYLGAHSGGYTPFEFDLGKSLKREGENLLAIRVVDVHGGGDVPDLPNEISLGTQTPEQAVSGIWGSVFIEGRPKAEIRDVTVQTDLDPSRLICRCFVASRDSVKRALYLRGEILTGHTPIAVAEAQLPEGFEGPCDLELLPREGSRFALWSPEKPRLYPLVISLVSGEETLDRVRLRAGLRTIQTSDSRLLLNGNPMFVRGLLYTGIYPGGNVWPPSEEFAQREISKIRYLGFNLIRSYREPLPPWVLDACDRIGLMVWEESPIGEACPWLGGERAEEAAASEVMDMVRRDRHHPSVMIWGLADEKECATSAGAERWLRNLRKQVRELDPKRPVVINPDSLHRSRVLGGNDLLDFQEYLDVPENIAPPRTSPESSFPSLGSINSAFGAWGFPRTGNLEKENVYDRRFARLRELFDALRLNDTFPSLDHFCEATQVRQFETIQHHVDRYRLNPKVKGYILRQGRDTPSECTGIADFCGRPRSFEDRFVGLNAPLRVVVQWPTRNFWGGESLGLPWALSNARGRPVPKWTVKYQFSIGDQEYQEAQIDGGAIEPAETVRPEPLVLGVPEVEDIIPAKLTFKTSAPGIQPSESAWRFWLYPPLESVVAGTTSVNVPGLWPELWKYVPRLEAASVSACDVMIAREWSPSVAEFLEKGGAVLLAAERFAAGKVGVEDGIKDPHKTSFVRRYHPVFAEFPNCFAVDWRFHELVPRKLLSGVRYPLIGYFRGWDYLGAAMAEFRVGRGRLLVTTLRFDHLGIDPMTSHLLYAMIQYVADDRFRPVEMLAP